MVVADEQEGKLKTILKVFNDGLGLEAEGILAASKYFVK